ncbi:uncharacterized protein NESG_01114 [Nematocida ausubeli]|uniref:Uncharacterized protein n=1 Tax=Nematocida ausubeli (strain ATCC PRA-371 / ERTm2) TaxID=1913371 RepID=A0A086J1I4_NEMA1|nr:uncharacterized protein NESG_01114 [Nematocida ausubeli]KFG26002.1 hypothetical protein NESG_01114 [Nematocida ausubeli]
MHVYVSVASTDITRTRNYKDPVQAVQLQSRASHRVYLSTEIFEVPVLCHGSVLFLFFCMLQKFLLRSLHACSNIQKLVFQCKLQKDHSNASDVDMMHLDRSYVIFIKLVCFFWKG